MKDWDRKSEFLGTQSPLSSISVTCEHYQLLSFGLEPIPILFSELVVVVATLVQPVFLRK